MPKSNKKYKITYGGWYQRTTLHLSEIYDLFMLGRSKLDLSKKKLKELQKLLDIKKVTREAGYLEYVKVKTNSGIEIRYYEDGLYVLELLTDDIKNGHKKLEEYYNEKLNPALSYIFSLGAPTPKVLANIEAIHPAVVGLTFNEPENFNVEKEKYGEVYSKITSNNVTVYKTPDYIFIVTDPSKKASMDELVEMQIFFREFKDQLEKYLIIHRTIWEEISGIKERKYIVAKEVGETRSKLESYKKTIDLISSRINQMDTYVHTRQSIAKDLKMKGQLVTLFQYKFDVLSNTQEYIKDIWNMTSDYIDSAIQVVVEIENKSTAVGIETLQKITSVGVVSGILGYLAAGKLPTISASGFIYFAILILSTWLINYLLARLFKNKKYPIVFTERTKNI
jgi:hypothetical protein